MYDPRVGRWLSIDPITHHWESPYVGLADNPIYFTDPTGTKTVTPTQQNSSSCGPPPDTDYSYRNRDGKQIFFLGSSCQGYAQPTQWEWMEGRYQDGSWTGTRANFVLREVTVTPTSAEEAQQKEKDEISSASYPSLSPLIESYQSGDWIPQKTSANPNLDYVKFKVPLGGKVGPVGAQGNYVFMRFGRNDDQLYSGKTAAYIEFTLNGSTSTGPGISSGFNINSGMYYGLDNTTDPFSLKPNNDRLGSRSFNFVPGTYSSLKVGPTLHYNFQVDGNNPRFNQEEFGYGLSLGMGPSGLNVFGGSFPWEKHFGTIGASSPPFGKIWITRPEITAMDSFRVMHSGFADSTINSWAKRQPQAKLDSLEKIWNQHNR